MVYVIDKTGRSSRTHDIEALQRARNSSIENIRNNAEKSLNQIRHEGKHIESMRQSLIRAHREQNTSEIKDIHDYVTTHSRYRTEK